jgi:endonuclease-3 related protein
VKKSKLRIKKIYKLLDSHFGDLAWWPADSGFEVIVGAVLTQNTAWGNVEKAIKALKKDKLLTPKKIATSHKGKLARTITSAGYFNVKAERLKNVSKFLLAECGGKLDRLEKFDTKALREKLLQVKGIGPETADSILVYALLRPVFVVDAYAKRIFSRHRLITKDAGYHHVQDLVHENFPQDIKKLNQFHALIVEVGKKYCRKKAGLCKECPLRSML